MSQYFWEADKGMQQFASLSGQSSVECTTTLDLSILWLGPNLCLERFIKTRGLSSVTNTSHVMLTSGKECCGVMRQSLLLPAAAKNECIAAQAATRTRHSLGEPLSAPVLVGVRELYEPSEIIKIGCQSSSRHPLDHTKPTLQWFLQGSQVGSELVTPYGSALKRGVSGVSLRIPGEKVVSAGGQMVAQCRLTLGPHRLASNITLKVRPVSTTYHDYHASGSRHADSSCSPNTFQPAVTSCGFLVAALLLPGRL